MGTTGEEENKLTGMPKLWQIPRARLCFRPCFGFLDHVASIRWQCDLDGIQEESVAGLPPQNLKSGSLKLPLSSLTSPHFESKRCLVCIKPKAMKAADIKSSQTHIPHYSSSQTAKYSERLER